MQNDASFTQHIQKVCSKVRQKTGWLLRSFYNRQTWFLRHMWNAIIQPHLDYCSQLWFPGEGEELKNLEKLLKDFTSKVPEVRHLSYWERLKHMKMNSEQRRMDRYKILYVWKALEGKVPDCGVTLVGEDEDRLGRRCAIPTLKPKQRMKRNQSFQICGPLLFNCLPKHIRNLTKIGIDKFKVELDAYLSQVPDEPKVGDLMPQNSQQSNSLLHQVERRS